MDIDTAETLAALIDGCIGTSDSDDFNDEMIPVRNRLEKAIKKFRQKVSCEKCGYPLFKMHHENKIRCHGCDNVIELKGSTNA
ncbi:hypothetical protein FKG96_09980 [Olivibacter sp. LS-1]|uniref:hypothetical protein n=1 Tax=Olivibacter sp. LS-1 TaxID=2592345 RepID=UPI0011EAE2C8|nr:hypothetical protein [Olivibacter sp. LS-1]QEL01122.1 hypothetical protein FKG96_09980 [Olivibacter sp. LS-1]